LEKEKLKATVSIKVFVLAEPLPFEFLVEAVLQHLVVVTSQANFLFGIFSSFSKCSTMGEKNLRNF
jgi:hypothetical protein